MKTKSGMKTKSDIVTHRALGESWIECHFEHTLKLKLEKKRLNLELNKFDLVVCRVSRDCVSP